MATYVENGTDGIRFGLARLGKAGRGIVPSILKYPNATLSAVADLNEEALAAFATPFHTTKRIRWCASTTKKRSPPMHDEQDAGRYLQWEPR